jgi:hydrogenase nickel incorporation protein HypA/HybF
MHEIHLVRELAAVVEKEAAARGAQRVKLVRLKFNPLASHSAEHVQFCFDVVKQESALLAGARLELTQVPGLVRCQDCGHEFETSQLPDLCPKCGSINLAAVHPTHLLLEGFEAE